MIYDKLSNITKYNFQHNKGLVAAAAFLGSLDLSSLKAGYKAAYENFTISVSEYMTKPREAAKYEMHKKAIDIHMVLEGCEYLECTDSSEVEIDEPYQESRDAALGSAENNCSIRLKPGWFLICFPQDAHLVGAHEHDPQRIRKCIVKVY